MYFKWIVSFLLPLTLLQADIVAKRQPNWLAKTVATYPSTNPKQIVLYAPDSYLDVDLPVQSLFFYESGSLQHEVELTVVSKDHPSYKIWKTTVVPHGVAVSYSVEGNLAKVAFFFEGELEGQAKTYYPSGELQSAANYRKGVLEGSYREYSTNGSLTLESFYMGGKLQGGLTRFHHKEQKSCSCSYRDGLLEGEYLEWYPSGGVKSRQFYSQGLLNDSGNIPALTKYHENHTITHLQHFRSGQPEGAIVRYDESGKKIYQGEFHLGQKSGVEYFYSQDRLIGSGQYVRGRAVGEHYREDPESSQILYRSFEGRVEEFYRSGVKKLQYQILQGVLEGPYFAFYPNGELQHIYHYASGELDGTQRDFYPDGQIKKEAQYKRGEREGFYREWSKNGQQILSLSFHNDLREGKSEQWYANGRIKRQEEYREAVPCNHTLEWTEEGQLLLDIDHTEKVEKRWYPSGERSYYKDPFLEVDYYENGQKRGEAHYKNGLLEGPFLEWYEEGEQKTVGAYHEGLASGIWQSYYPPLPGRPLQLFRQAEYVAGEYAGKISTYYLNGAKKSSIPYKEGLLEGIKELWDANGQIVQQTQYLGGKVEGSHFERRADQTVIVSHYKNNRLEGLYQLFYPKNAEGQQVKSFEVPYQKGLYEGEAINYSQEGVKISSTPYHLGKKEGEAALFTKEGAVILVATFRGDLKHGPSYEYFPSGALQRECLFVEDLKEGEERVYFEDGSLASLNLYKGGLLEGVCRSWNPEGVLIFEAEYAQGKKQGFFNKYYEDGSPKVLQRFVDDKLQPNSKKVFNQL